jgi:hypothetical protein
MNATYQITASSDKTTGEEYFEGTVQLPGLKTAKLVKNDGCTRYSSKSQVVQAARRLSERYNLCLTSAEEASTPVRKAAKKSINKSGSYSGW